jgi:hypothetical protein
MIHEFRNKLMLIILIIERREEGNTWKMDLASPEHAIFQLQLLETSQKG